MTPLVVVRLLCYILSQARQCRRTPVVSVRPAFIAFAVSDISVVQITDFGQGIWVGRMSAGAPNTAASLEA